MRTPWITLPVAALILAGCGHTSRVDDVDAGRPRSSTVATSAPSATPTAEPAVTPTATESLPPVTAKPAVTAKPKAKAKPRPKKTTQAPEPEPDDVYYANCTEVRDADADPIRTGDPGYSRKLDRDGDGVACE